VTGGGAGAPTVPLTWVDAFTDRAFAGNPAAVCLLDAPAPEGWMQGLAAELGLSETAFVVPQGDAWSLRWFTPGTEVDLCGHATLAAAHVLRTEGRVTGDEPIRFATRSGELRARPVDGRLELDFPASPPVAVDDAGPGAALGLDAVLVARGLLHVIVVADAAAVAAYQPDLAAIAALHPFAVALTAPGDPGAPEDYVVRVFGPNVAIPEDPVTGSAACTLGPLWSQRLGKDALEAAQLSARRGRMWVTTDGGRVRIAGDATTVLTGQVVGPP
jgi:predicted PhzF superfamily epimerase YddE/YHI9